MKLTKLSKSVKWTHTNIRLAIKLFNLGLHVPGRPDNMKRIYHSDLSWQEKFEWANKIINFRGTKSENFNWLSVVHNSEEIANEKLNCKSEKLKSDKNPFFNHGGKLSVYSKNNPNFSESKRTHAANRNRLKQLDGGSPRVFQYWINKGYTPEEAKLKLYDFQNNFTLEKCKQRHGEDEGERIYRTRQENWQNTLNSKSEEELSIINRKKISKGFNTSKGEQLIYNTVLSIIPEVESQFTLKRLPRGYYNYDIHYNGRIIEYNGDFWHMNPKTHNESHYNIRTKRSAKDQWDLDKAKLSHAESLGYKTLVIWESELKLDKQKVIDKCINFLTQ